jgi:YVTN family beta-propeller protein
MARGAGYSCGRKPGALLSIALLTSACGTSLKVQHDEPPPPPQASAPTFSPPAGTYTLPQSVSVSSVTPGAAIHYTTDGSTPTAASPVATAEIAVGATITLQAIAVASGYADSEVASSTYTINLPPAPSVTFVPGPPQTMGLLSSYEFAWQSDTAGSYVVVLGGTGGSDSGVVLATGSVAAGVLVGQAVNGTQLSYDGPSSLWVHVTDAFGRTGTAWTDLTLKPMAAIDVGTIGLGRIAVHPDGHRVYVARSYANEVAVIDADPASATFNTILAAVPAGDSPMGVAVTPDGSRVYVTNGGSGGVDGISVLSTVTNTVVASVPLADSAAPSGIAITPDGTRAYFLRADEKISVLDVDPYSPTYHAVTADIPRAFLAFGAIVIAPDGMRAVVNWQGTAHGVDVIDVASASASYDRIVSSPVPVVSGLAGDAAISPDGAVAFATDAMDRLCRIDLASGVITATGPFAPQFAFALTPDGTTILMGSRGVASLDVVKGSDLSLTLSVPMGAGLGSIGGIAITPDGARAYVARGTDSTGVQIVMVPLL